MNNLARQQPAQPSLEYGRIASTGNGFTVALPFGDIVAQRAASCMMRPEAGDTVLVSVDMNGGAWILAVLERAGNLPTALELQGDAVLHVRSGGLTVAPETELNCVTGKAALSAAEAKMTAGDISLAAKRFSSQVERVKRVSGTVSDISREFTRRVVNYFRFTAEHDELQSQSSRQLVEKTAAIQSRNTVIMSEKKVKIDGELIHMG